MNISQKFEQWMAKYQRVYSNSSEKEERFAIFRNNLKNINIFNSRGAENFTQRINSFGDLTDEEFRSRYLGSFHIPNTTTTSSSFFKYQSIKDEDLSDATVDWRRDIWSCHQREESGRMWRARNNGFTSDDLLGSHASWTVRVRTDSA
ncbi:hypothetical protein ACLB2K_023593 [Fragaria x ananassa]